MDQFLLDAIPLDADLVSDYPEVIKLADQIFEEVSGVAKTTNKYRSKEALKLILINLYHGLARDRAVRYSRDKAFYAPARRYGQIWFKYDRVIPIIDTLKELGYVEHKDGLHYPEDDVLYQSRIWASQKLIYLFYALHFQEIKFVKKLPPKEIIQLRKRRKSGGSLMKYKDTNKTETMRHNLRRYNRFIEKQAIEVNLPADVPVSLSFLEIRKGNVLNQRIDITKFATDNDMEFVFGDTGERYKGCRLNGQDFIIIPEEGTASAANIINKINHSINKIQHITYNEYFIHYINNLLSIHYTNNFTTLISNTTIPTPLLPISMTQSFYSDHQENQLVDTQMTTTVEDHLVKRPLAEYGIRQLTFRSNFQHLHRVFVLGFDWGGRFYGAVHMDLPKEIREFITINGSPTVELDYSAHHIRILYNWEKIPYAKDPYEELCDNPDERSIYKKVLLISINAKDEVSAIKAISDELRNEGHTGKVLKHDFIRGCLDKFKEHHEPIAKYLHQSYGLDLQYTDSRIADKVLYQMVSKKIPTLPVHDSFIVPVEHGETLREVMVEAYQKIMGKGFFPILK